MRCIHKNAHQAEAANRKPLGRLLLLERHAHFQYASLSHALHFGFRNGDAVLLPQLSTVPEGCGVRIKYKNAFIAIANETTVKALH